MSGGDVTDGHRILLKVTPRSREKKRPNATYTFANGKTVRGHDDESCSELKARYQETFGGVAPAIIEEARDHEDVEEDGDA